MTIRELRDKLNQLIERGYGESSVFCERDAGLADPNEPDAHDITVHGGLIL